MGGQRKIVVATTMSILRLTKYAFKISSKSVKPFRRNRYIKTREFYTHEIKSYLAAPALFFATNVYLEIYF